MSAAFTRPKLMKRIENLVFGQRALLLTLVLLLSLLLGWQATRLQVNASFDKSIPASHPFIQKFLEHRRDLQGLGNSLRIAVQAPSGSIYSAEFLESLRRLNDQLFLLPGVDRTQLKSLWTASTRWVAVTEEGLEGGPVIPDGYDGSPASLAEVQRNVARAGLIGHLVAADERSTLIQVPLLAVAADGRPLDYGAFARRLDELRERFEAERGVRLHITGYARIVGDLIEGIHAVLKFFALAALIVTAMVYAYIRCARSTAIVVIASLLAVVWLLGLLPLLGMQLDPYSVLVPFLVFAIGMSHGAQKMNGVMQDIGRGMPRLQAARRTFERLFLAGLTALLADALGFAVLLIVDIASIRELALAAALGVLILIVTNLILIPVLLSYTGVSLSAARRSLRLEAATVTPAAPVGHGVWDFLVSFTGRRRAALALTGAAVLALGAAWAARGLAIGDLQPGAPELRTESRYNRDAAFMASAYGAASDVLAVMVETPEGQCAATAAVQRVDALAWELRQLEGVEGTAGMGQLVRQMMVGLNEGNPKWADVVANQDMINTITSNAPRGFYNDACSLLTLYVYLADHKAQTLQRVVAQVQDFARRHDSAQARFVLGAGSAGIEAATNAVVAGAWRQMSVLVYAAVALLAWLTFRSWRATLMALLPLLLTSLLAEALMVALHIGVKVATLPVIALGVGIGVDYALYIVSVALVQWRQGVPFHEAYRAALLFTGRVVMLTGLTLFVGVMTWVASPIKFQADMGLLLAFMFLVNMLGALLLLPALGAFLLRGRGRAA